MPPYPISLALLDTELDLTTILSWYRHSKPQEARSCNLEEAPLAVDCPASQSGSYGVPGYSGRGTHSPALGETPDSTCGPATL